MFNHFTHQYSLSKTLRFELKPVGETADYLEDFKSQHLKDFIEKDQQRAEDYKIIKELIDDYHRQYIEEKLSAPVDPKTGELWLNPEDFEEAYSYYQKLKADQSDPKNRKQWEDIQTELRKKLVKAFTNKAGLFKKELITRDLPEFLKRKGQWEENKKVVENFSRFTTYFSGFHENRKNMYTHEDHSTAIAYRLMNENLPRFFNNCLAYKHIKDKYNDLPLKINSELQSQLGVTNINDFFQPRYFINLFSQTGIDNYELLIGGKTEENGTKIQGLNEQINLYRQQLQHKMKDEAKADDKKSKRIYDLSGFTHLYKQILSDREKISFIPEAFEDDKQLLASLEEYIATVTDEKEGAIKKLEQSLQKLANADLSKVYIKGAGLTDLSRNMFGAYGMITASLSYYADEKLSTKKKPEDYLKQKVYSLDELNHHLIAYIDSKEKDDVLHEQLAKLPNPKQPISSYLVSIIKQTQQDVELQTTIDAVKPLLKLESLSKARKAPELDNENDEGAVGFQQVQKIQKMLDGFKSILHAVKLLHLVDGRKPIDMPDKDDGFYNDFAEVYEAYTNLTVTLYNKARNHLTKKLYSNDKIKINFDKANLLNGFVESQTDKSYNGTQYGGYLFRKRRDDGGFNYYLGISSKNNLFRFDQEISDELSKYERLNYYQAKTNSIYGSSYIGNYGDDKSRLINSVISFLEKNNMEEADNIINGFNELVDQQKTPTRLFLMILESSQVLLDQVRADKEVNLFERTLMTNLKETLRNFKDKAPALFALRKRDFQSIKEFQLAIEEAVTNKSFVYKNISKSEMDEVLTNNTMQLFWIYSKDFSEKRIKRRKRIDNLHTLYFKALMSGTNDRYDLGKGDVFFRKHSIEKHATHPKGEAIKNKTSNAKNKTSKFNYNLYKDKRYAVDKFLFHLSIEINYQKSKSPSSKIFNDQINKTLAQQKETCVIGIDRGERHLLYYTVVNSKGEIIEQDTLNTINTDKGYNVDYQQKLHTKEKEREKARKSWSSVENIKELKAGYLSHVVHKLAHLIIKHNAIVCLEDLNSGFKRGRFKVEKQVYQKFEKALIDKLNYLVFKENKANDAGGYLNAYQLTAPFESFEKLFKQTGILYYVRADYTSKIDPATGFIDFLRPRYESLAKSKTFFENIESFKFNQAKDYFEMEFDYKKMKPSQKLGSYQSKWKVCTFGDVRYQNRRNDKGVWESEVINVTKKLKALLDDHDIEYQQEQDLKEALILKKDTKFYKELFWLLKLTLSLRHSKSGTEEDFILSPVANEQGVFFDSRNASDTQPKDADANGAYNIALKGLWNLQQIKKHDWDAEKPKKLNLAMKNEEWFGFAQNKEYKN